MDRLLDRSARYGALDNCQRQRQDVSATSLPRWERMLKVAATALLAGLAAMAVCGRYGPRSVAVADGSVAFAISVPRV